MCVCDWVLRPLRHQGCFALIHPGICGPRGRLGACGSVPVDKGHERMWALRPFTVMGQAILSRILGCLRRRDFQFMVRLISCDRPRPSEPNSDLQRTEAKRLPNELCPCSLLGRKQSGKESNRCARRIQHNIRFIFARLPFNRVKGTMRHTVAGVSRQPQSMEGATGQNDEACRLHKRCENNNQDIV